MPGLLLSRSLSSWKAARDRLAGSQGQALSGPVDLRDHSARAGNLAQLFLDSLPVCRKEAAGAFRAGEPDNDPTEPCTWPHTSSLWPRVRLHTWPRRPVPSPEKSLSPCWSGEGIRSLALLNSVVGWWLGGILAKLVLSLLRVSEERGGVVARRGKLRCVPGVPPSLDLGALTHPPSSGRGLSWL